MTRKRQGRSEKGACAGIPTRSRQTLVTSRSDAPSRYVSLETGRADARLEPGTPFITSEN
jgi:hypothetical protein